MGNWSGVLAVGCGAAVGAWMRWGLGLLLNPLFGGLPLGTLAANLIGGFAMGAVLAWVQAVPELTVATRLFLTTGLLGGLTTFSAFSGEVFQMLQRQDWGWATGAVLLHVGGSLLMTFAGWTAVQAAMR